MRNSESYVLQEIPTPNSRIFKTKFSPLGFQGQQNKKKQNQWNHPVFKVLHAPTRVMRASILGPPARPVWYDGPLVASVFQLRSSQRFFVGEGLTVLSVHFSKGMISSVFLRTSGAPGLTVHLGSFLGSWMTFDDRGRAVPGGWISFSPSILGIWSES